MNRCDNCKKVKSDVEYSFDLDMDLCDVCEYVLSGDSDSTVRRLRRRHIRSKLGGKRNLAFHMTGVSLFVLLLSFIAYQENYPLRFAVIGLVVVLVTLGSFTRIKKTPPHVPRRHFSRAHTRNPRRIRKRRR